MPVFLQTSNRAVPVKDSLRKRERQVMAAAMAHAVDVDAFSISFVAKKSSVKALIYMRQPVAQESSHTLEDDDGEEQEAGNEQAALAPVPAPADTTRDARSSSQAASLSGASTQVVGNKSPASAKGAPRSKPAASRIDKNALSARGTGASERSTSQPQTQRSSSPPGSRDAMETDAPRGGSNRGSPTPRPPFKPWASHMFKALPGPPPSDHGLRGGKWVTAREAAIDYGDPTRQIWWASNGKAWEADGADHISGVG